MAGGSKACHVFDQLSRSKITLILRTATGDIAILSSENQIARIVSAPILLLYHCSHVSDSMSVY